jgi:ATP-dependent DNA helicase RecG
MIETQDIEKKSIKILRTDLSDVSGTFVAFSNARGGFVKIGIEDDDALPPVNQKIKQRDLDKVKKRIGELTYNVGITVEKIIADNGGEYIQVRIFPSETSIASTCDGRYFMRVGDQCRPVMPDELSRLFTDKGSFIWELKERGISKSRKDISKSKRLISIIKASDRVIDFVKQKSDEEILEHYNLVCRGKLTNLGVLWIGNREDRARLAYPPVIQFIKYDENDNKVKKYDWSDYTMSPLEMIESVWNQLEDLKEYYEIPDGIFRQNIPQFDEAVIRELLVNALVHRPYNQRGDIYINLYPDRLEITNPGRLPIGVTPQNILHAKQHRNSVLCQLCYAIKIMEKEGSGFDMIYEKLVTSGRPIPVVIEGVDSVTVRIYKRVLDNRIVDLLSTADQRFVLTQREKITLGIIAQNESIQILDLAKQLELSNATELNSWIGKLKTKGLIISISKTKGTGFLLNPSFIKSIGFTGKTSLKGIEGYRLRELILTDLERYEISNINEIHLRIGEEIPIRRLRKELSGMVKEGKLKTIGNTRWTKYLLTKKR